MTAFLTILVGCLVGLCIGLYFSLKDRRERNQWLQERLEQAASDLVSVQAQYEAERTLANALGASLLKPLGDSDEDREQLARIIQTGSGIGVVYCRGCEMILGRGYAGHTPRCPVGKALGDWMYLRRLQDHAGANDPATAAMLEDNLKIWRGQGEEI